MTTDHHHIYQSPSPTLTTSSPISVIAAFRTRPNINYKRPRRRVFFLCRVVFIAGAWDLSLDWPRGKQFTQIKGKQANNRGKEHTSRFRQLLHGYLYYPNSSHGTNKCGYYRICNVDIATVQCPLMVGRTLRYSALSLV